MPVVPTIHTSAKDQMRNVQNLIDRMFGNDVHERPLAKQALKNLIQSERHADDCAQKSGLICNCGLREAKTFIQAEDR